MGEARHPNHPGELSTDEALGGGADASTGTSSRRPGPGHRGAPGRRGALPGRRRLRLRHVHRHLPRHEGPGPLPAQARRGAGARGARRRTAGAPSAPTRSGSTRPSRASTSSTSSSRSGNGVAVVDDEWFEPRADGQGLRPRACLVAPAEEMIWSKAFVLERERYRRRGREPPAPGDGRASWTGSGCCAASTATGRCCSAT